MSDDADDERDDFTRHTVPAVALSWPRVRGGIAGSGARADGGG